MKAHGEARTDCLHTAELLRHSALSLIAGHGSPTDQGNYVKEPGGYSVLANNSIYLVS